MSSRLSIRPRAWALAVALATLTAAPASPASAAPGGIRFLGCLSGKLAAKRAPLHGGCALTRTAAGDAEGSGLDHLRALTASPDGRSLYAVSSREDSVLGFRAAPLGLRQCFSGNRRPRGRRGRGCTLFPHAGTEDALTGFNAVRFIAVSPDGRNAYTVSGDDSIGVFARARRSGGLTYEGCLTGHTGRASSARSGACTPIPTATPAALGIHSGIGDPTSLAISPDGRFVYVAARGDAGVATLVRRRNGSLAFRDCLTGGISGFVAGLRSACALLADASGNPTATILRGISRIVLSPDGTSLYASSPRRAAIAEFQRDPLSGALSYRGCVTGEYGRPGTAGLACTPVPGAREAAFGSGMWGIDRMAISPDGRWLYGAALHDGAIDAFSRDPATGALSFAGCITGNRGLGGEGGGGNPCAAPARDGRRGAALDRPTDLAIAPGGRALYVTAARDSAITRLARNPSTGALGFYSCLSANPDLARPAGPCELTRPRRGRHQLGFSGLSSLAFARGGLYATAGGQSAISRFAAGG